MGKVKVNKLECRYPFAISILVCFGKGIVQLLWNIKVE